MIVTYILLDYEIQRFKIKHLKKGNFDTLSFQEIKLDHISIFCNYFDIDFCA